MVLPISLGFLRVILMILAAQATPPAEPTAIPPVVWELVSYTQVGGSQVEIADPSRYTLQFLTNGDLNARLDCNQGHGSYSAVDGVLSLTELASTLMLCASDSQDAQFTQILSRITAYELDSDGFLVLSGSTGQLRLRASPTSVS